MFGKKNYNVYAYIIFLIVCCLSCMRALSKSNCF